MNNLVCIDQQLLVALVSAYRYEGPHVHKDTAKSEAKILLDAIRSAGKKALIDDEKLIMILATRSKSHLRAVYECYREISGKHLDEVI
jgi:annexin D